MLTAHSGPSLEFREATLGDEAEVWPLADALATSCRPTRARFADSFATIVRDTHSTILIATRESEIAGYVHVLTHPAFHADGSIGWIEELMVRESERGRGCGRALVAEAERWALAKDDIAYMALATRRAGEFYRSIGYDESATYFKSTFR